MVATIGEGRTNLDSDSLTALDLDLRTMGILDELEVGPLSRNVVVRGTSGASCVLHRLHRVRGKETTSIVAAISVFQNRDAEFSSRGHYVL